MFLSRLWADNVSFSDRFNRSRQRRSAFDQRFRAYRCSAVRRTPWLSAHLSPTRKDTRRSTSGRVVPASEEGPDRAGHVTGVSPSNQDAHTPPNVSSHILNGKREARFPLVDFRDVGDCTLAPPPTGELEHPLSIPLAPFLPLLFVFIERLCYSRYLQS